MSFLWWKTLGKGRCHLILLHGWGLNAKIWNCISNRLSAYFTLHLVDLPGFGRSFRCGAMKLNRMAECILKKAPDEAVWLGWSLGGLIESWIATVYPRRVQALITAASSPCFREKDTWPGIKIKKLIEFQDHLNKNFSRTVERFLTLQTIRTDTMRKDTLVLKKIASSVPLINILAFQNGLEILKTTDLREPLSKLTLPHLRIYGELDELVPNKIIPLLDEIWPTSESVVMNKAAHALCISHPSEFCQIIIDFNYRMGLL